jgi:ABC-type dipeptide/oligopeptide/nickel transport system ATPase component
MAELCAIVGNSGTGKSTSIRTLDPKSTFIINIARKPLPFRGAKKNYIPLTKDGDKWVGNLYNTSDVNQIANVLKMINAQRPDIQTVVIEDAQYIMAFEAMDRSAEKGYEKFTQMASNFYSVLKNAMNLRDDLKVFVLTHAENTGDALNPSYKIKTIGKMIDSMITVEGLFTYVFFTDVVKGENDVPQYKLITQSDGTTTAKTPMGCFEELRIDNDLQYICNKIDEYNS